MDGLCGTSSLWLTSVSALEPKYNKNGKCEPHTSCFPDLCFANEVICAVVAAATYGEETFIPGMPWNAGTCTDGVGVWNLYPNPRSLDPDR